VLKLFIFGLGYSSQYIAQAAIKAGFLVAGTCRTQEKCDQLKAQGIEAFVFANSHPTLLPLGRGLLESATHILSSIPPQEIGDVVLPFLALTANCQPPTASWLGYLSTTGVYGDYQGEWVDEQSELRPNNERLKRRVAAEKAWQEKRGHVFRLAGIYGPRRSAIDDVRDGTARRIDKPGQVFSRIHVEDIAQVVLASMLKPNPGAAYNVCDDEPAPAHEVVKFACELLGKVVPALIPYGQAEMSVMGREFYSANRRVKNARIKNELGVTLKYPSYREGLAKLVNMA